MKLFVFLVFVLGALPLSASTQFKSCYCEVFEAEGESQTYDYNLKGLFIDSNGDPAILNLANGRARYNVITEDGWTGIRRAEQMCKTAKSSLQKDGACPGSQ